MCSLFAAICGRSRLLDLKIDRLLTITLRMEKQMSDLLDKIAAAQAAAKEAVEAERKSHADEITAAVAKAKAAWEADDAAEHAAALSALDSMIASLKEPAPGFSPSAN